MSNKLNNAFVARPNNKQHRARASKNYDPVEYILRFDKRVSNANAINSVVVKGIPVQWSRRCKIDFIWVSLVFRCIPKDQIKISGSRDRGLKLSL